MFINGSTFPNFSIYLSGQYEGGGSRFIDRRVLIGSGGPEYLIEFEVKFKVRPLTCEAIEG